MGAAAIVAGAASSRFGGSRGLAGAAAANGYPSTTAALRSWLPGGGSERARIGNSQYVLINDPTSPREYVFHENVPPGGHISVNRDGSATIYNKEGQPVGQIAKPWAYDSLGRPQRTWYTVDSNGDLVQHVDPEPNALYPILADPLSGGEDPATGKSITATPLANGQEAVEGEGNGTQVVGTPDPGRTPYQPNTDTMLPDSQITVDQGDGTTEKTTTYGETPSTTTESTEQAYQETADYEAAARDAQERRAAHDPRLEKQDGIYDPTDQTGTVSTTPPPKGESLTSSIKEDFKSAGRFLDAFYQGPAAIVSIRPQPDGSLAPTAPVPEITPKDIVGTLNAVLLLALPVDAAGLVGQAARAAAARAAEAVIARGASRTEAERVAQEAFDSTVTAAKNGRAPVTDRPLVPEIDPVPSPVQPPTSLPGSTGTGVEDLPTSISPVRPTQWFDRTNAPKIAERLPQDIAVNPRPPLPLETDRPIGRNIAQNQFVQQRIRELRGLNVDDILVNQQQVNFLGDRVGINRPDLQYSLGGRRFYEEFDLPSSDRGFPHLIRLIANDPDAIIALFTIP